MISKRKQSIRGKNVKGKFTGSGLVGDHPLYGHCFKGKKDHGGQPGLILIIKMVKYDFLAVHNSSIGDLVTDSLTQDFTNCHSKSDPRDL